MIPALYQISGPSTACLPDHQFFTSPSASSTSTYTFLIFTMPTYTITIKNNSSQSQSFVLFQDLPKPANIPRDNVFTNVYQRAARVSNSAEARFQISSDLYALHGASHRTDDGMVQVETSEYRPARLGPQGSRFYLTTENSRGQFPRFGKEDDSVQAGGAFAISSDGTFDFRNPGKSRLFVRIKPVF